MSCYVSCDETREKFFSPLNTNKKGWAESIKKLLETISRSRRCVWYRLGRRGRNFFFFFFSFCSFFCVIIRRVCPSADFSGAAHFQHKKRFDSERRKFQQFLASCFSRVRACVEDFNDNEEGARAWVWNEVLWAKRLCCQSNTSIYEASRPIDYDHDASHANLPKGQCEKSKCCY